MHIGEKHVSVSLTTIELDPVDGGTRVTFTEQGAFLEGGPASATSRTEGSEYLLDCLGRALAATQAAAAS
jgi:hypothetical protein